MRSQRERERERAILRHFCQDPPGGVCREVEFERRTRRGRSRTGDLASGGLRSDLIFATEYIFERDRESERDLPFPVRVDWFLLRDRI
jgi:hypothetical protein